jgi:predicted ATPase
VHWYRGDSTLAAQVGSTALNLARTCDSPHSKVFTYGLVGWLAVLQGDIDVVQSLATQQLELAEEYGLAYWKQWAQFLEGTVMTRRGDAARGIASVRAAIDGMRAIGAKLGLQHLYCVIAEALLAAGRPAEARAELAAASAQIAETGEGLYAAEIRRLEGEAALAADNGPSGRASAKLSFDAALEIARAQGALALEQRAANRLARHFAQDGLAPRALRVLEPARGA